MRTHDAHTDGNGFDGTQTAGRKGLPYDWQSVLAKVAVDDLDAELAALSPQFAD